MAKILKELKNQPRTKRQPGYNPKIVIDHHKGNPVWRFQRMDFGGPYSWQTIDRNQMETVIRTLGKYEDLTWHDLDARSHNHPTRITAISEKARNRLLALDAQEDHLYQIKIRDKQRVWGILVRGEFSLLWWDPNHEIYQGA